MIPMYSVQIFLDRYANRPNELENTCYADFARNYRPTNADRKFKPDDIETYVESITNIEITTDSHQACFKKREKL